MKGWDTNDGSTSETSELGGQEIREGSKEMRLFCISVDICSFKATHHLPMRSINAFVRVVLPSEIMQLALKACNVPSKVTAPLRTHPPVLVERGTEVNISNGYVALDLPASPDSMATMLALQPELTAHVFHRDKYAADSVVGTATIPMQRLMDQTLVDAYAPVQGASNIGGKIEDVKIGTLRIVLAIADLGLVGGPDALRFKIGPSPGPTRPPRSDDPPGSRPKIPYPANSSHVEKEVESGHNSEEAEPGEILQQISKTGIGVPCKRRRKSISPNRKAASPRNRFSSAVDTDEKMKEADVKGQEGLRKRPEYEMAWEFEMWRRSEEAKWLANLKEMEAAKMNALEEEWKKKEKQRDAEMRKFQAEQADLEAKLRAKLFKLEKKERAIFLSEEDLAHRKEALERAYANRTSDAQVAVKRLQAECEHRVELERSKFTALQEQYTMLEQRLVSSNSSLSNLEKQFQDYKAAHRNTAETELLSQIIALKQQCGSLQLKAESAIHSRNDYKYQVLKLAKELAKLHREREAQRHQATQERSRLESQAVAALIESQCLKAREDRLELQQLKEQLNILQLREQECIAKKQSTSQISPKKMEQKPIEHSSPRRKIDMPNLDLSNVDNVTHDTQLSSGLRIFQDPSHLPKTCEPGSPTRPRQPLVDMSQKLKPITTNAKGRPAIPDTRYKDLQLIDIENEDSTLYDSELLGESKKSKIDYLRKQRAYLLGTGVYNVGDRVIKGLDQEIQMLRTGGSRSTNPYKNPTMSP